LRFTGDVHAVPEGTVFFPNEPILRVTAPLPQAQLVETRLINILHLQSLIAAKAARMGSPLRASCSFDFSLRRAHGAEAGLLAPRASYIAGFAGTATMLAGKLFGIPIYGTMAHSFIQAHDSEVAAFGRVDDVGGTVIALARHGGETSIHAHGWGATSAGRSSMMRGIRFQPPGPGCSPSGIGRPAELVGPLSKSRREPRVTSANAGA
jgi:nicotinic acid phosphoribosyltransferase